jgi:CubicO group peptidase (beta-lactamase class C family)
MDRLRVAVFSLAFAGLLVPAMAQSAAGQGITSEQVARIDAVFQEWNTGDAPAAAVAVTRDGRTIFSRGYGAAHLEYGIRATPTTPFHVASVSKQFATFAVALLARDGLLSWDDEVHEHLPELPDLGRPVTLRQLGHHTSGVRDQWELLAMAGWRLDDVITRDQIVQMMSRQRELNFEPGSEYLYSNMGYSLLAEVVERVSGQGFGAFLEERVFRPLGMHHTHVHDDHTHLVPGRAYSYRPSANGWQNAVLSYANQGATSLFTTVEDLARWIGEMESPRVGDRELWDELRRPGVLNSGDTIGYALGLSVGEVRGLRTVGHGGADAGFRSNLLHFPDERLGVVVFGASSSFDAGGKARAVAAVFLGDRMEPAPRPTVQGNEEDGEAEEAPEPTSSDPLEVYEGTYYAPELDTFYRLRVEDGTLVAVHQRHPPTELAVDGGDRFRGSAWFLRGVEFTRNEDGDVDGFRVSGSRVRNLRFVRVEDPAMG